MIGLDQFCTSFGNLDECRMVPGRWWSTRLGGCCAKSPNVPHDPLSYDPNLDHENPDGWSTTRQKHCCWMVVHWLVWHILKLEASFHCLWLKPSTWESGHTIWQTLGHVPKYHEAILGWAEEHMVRKDGHSRVISLFWNLFYPPFWAQFGIILDRIHFGFTLCECYFCKPYKTSVVTAINCPALSIVQESMN